MWLSGVAAGWRDQSSVAGGGEFWTRAAEQLAAGIVSPSLVTPGKGLILFVCVTHVHVCEHTQTHTYVRTWRYTTKVYKYT